MDTAYRNIEKSLIDNIPKDPRDALELLEHVIELLDNWSKCVREEISDSYVRV